MQMSRVVISLSVTALLLGACSSRPRQFVATVNPPAADEVAYQRDFATCDTLARKGYKSDFKAAALSTAGGTAVGVAAGIAATGIAVASTGTVVGGGLGGAINAAVLPGAIGGAVFLVAIIPAGFGISRAIRGGREKRLKRAVSSCLSEYGYTVDTWSRVKKAKKAAPMPT